MSGEADTGAMATALLRAVLPWPRLVPVNMQMALALSGLVVLASTASSQAQARQVVYDSSGGSVMARTDDTPPRRLALGGHPRISPDGRYVAFVNRDQTQVRLVPFSGGRQRVIARGRSSALHPRFIRTTWSADSRYVATSEVGNKISLYDARRRRTTVVRSYPRNETDDVGGLAFSPSGARIAFTMVGVDLESVYIMDAKAKAHATRLQDTDAGHPVWGEHAGCLAFTLHLGTRYDFRPSRIGLSCAGGKTFGEGSGSFGAVRWLSRTQLLGVQSDDRQVRAVKLNTATGQIAAISRPVQQIFDFSRDGKRMLATNGDALGQIALDTSDQAFIEIAPNALTASWTGS